MHRFVRALPGLLLWLGACEKEHEHHRRSQDLPLPPGAVAQVTDARIRPPLQGRDVTAAHMRIAALQAEQLTGVSSPGIARIELHTHRHVAGQMQMRRVESVPLPAGEWVEFRSGGLHLMLFGVRDLEAGQSLDLTLEFASGATQSVPFRVSVAERQAMSHPSGHH